MTKGKSSISIGTNERRNNSKLTTNLLLSLSLSLSLSHPSSMDSSKAEIAQEFPGMIRVYKDGHVERLVDTDFVPASNDTITGVTSKDITILSISNISISARLYLPTKLANPNQKLPLLVYFHGGAFCVSSPFT